MPSQTLTLKHRLAERGVSRRDFLKFCSVVAATLALPKALSPQVAYALEQAAARPPVIWLEFQDCAGDTESFLRGSRPTPADVILSTISLNYHETIMAPSGKGAEKSLRDTAAAGGHIVVVEGSIPTAENGIYCAIAGRTALDILAEATRSCAALIAVGSCAAFGGLPKVSPNPTGAVGVMDLVKDKPVVNLSGCPMNVVNFTALVVHYLTFGSFPALDRLNRPLFAHGQIIHNNCERRAHFDANEFVRAWGDEGHRKGWCLYQMGCKGPVATFNCPTVRWNDGVNWPVGAGHPCIACAAPDFFERPVYQPVDIQSANPPAFYPSVETPPPPVQPGGAAALGGVAGVIAGVGVTAMVVTARKRSNDAEEA